MGITVFLGPVQALVPASYCPVMVDWNLAVWRQMCEASHPSSATYRVTLESQVVSLSLFPTCKVELKVVLA